MDPLVDLTIVSSDLLTNRISCDTMEFESEEGARGGGSTPHIPYEELFGRDEHKGGYKYHPNVRGFWRGYVKRSKWLERVHGKRRLAVRARILSFYFGGD